MHYWQLNIFAYKIYYIRVIRKHLKIKDVGTIMPKGKEQDRNEYTNLYKNLYISS